MSKLCVVAFAAMLAGVALGQPMGWFAMQATVQGGGGGAELWTPAELGASVTFWIDASDTSQMWQDLSQTVPIVDGEQVASMVDKSSFDNLNASFPAADYKGAYLTNDALYFDSTADSQMRIAKLTETNLIEVGRSLYGVYYTGETYVGLGDGFIEFIYSANPTLRYGYQSTHSRLGDYWSGSYAVQLEGIIKQTKTVMVHQYANGITSTHWTNGTEAATGTLVGTWSAQSQTVWGNGREGYIHEVMIVENQDTAGRQKIEGYLAHKWGLAANLPDDHQYKNNPPTK